MIELLKVAPCGIRVGDQFDPVDPDGVDYRYECDAIITIRCRDDKPEGLMGIDWVPPDDNRDKVTFIVKGNCEGRRGLNGDQLRCGYEIRREQLRQERARFIGVLSEIIAEKSK